VAVLSCVAAAAPAAAATPPGPGLIVASVDLAKPFATRSPWRLAVRQGPPQADAFGADGDTVPGPITLCLQTSDRCDAQLPAMPPSPSGLADAWDAHYLNAAKVVFAKGRTAPPLLLVQTASLHSGDGDQLVFTQVLAYRRASDRFTVIHSQQTGRNNNQEVRLVDSGPLAGAVVFAEPTENAPFGYWITVNRLSPAYAYKQVLHYRSATHYGDGNPLAVIDSEMPDIEQRLGLWRPGAPLPLPAGPCPKPHLVNTVLWCS
jgi:hypothetical protein